jgi:hypothetical protein
MLFLRTRGWRTSNRHPRFRIAATLYLFALTCAPGPVKPMPTPQETLVATSDLFAACLVGVDAQREYWRKKGVNLTPRELVERHSRVVCQKDENGEVEVTFYPKQGTRGGDITYIVNLDDLSVVKTMYGR